MIPVVWPQTWAQSDGKRKTPFLFQNMWEVALPGKVGPQEKKGVFLSFMDGSSYESVLALGSKLIAGGLQVHLGALGLPKAKSLRAKGYIKRRKNFCWMYQYSH